MQRRLIVVLALVLCFSSCQRNNTVIVKNITVDRRVQHAQPVSCQKLVTVWIHGTQLLPPWAFSNFFYSMTGLHPVLEYDKKYGMYTMASMLSDADKEQFPLEHFYSFGWSGKLSCKERESVALELYAALHDLMQQYEQEHGQYPHLTIITHSHGGNVVLNMVNAQINPSWAIDRLILLACPVQKVTCDYVKHPLFRKIYSFYSKLDAVQILDPQGVQRKTDQRETPLFSERMFPTCKHLKQAKIKINSRGLFHVEFLLSRFLPLLPSIIEEVDAWSHHNGECSLNVKSKQNGTKQKILMDLI